MQFGGPGGPGGLFAQLAQYGPSLVSTSFNPTETHYRNMGGGFAPPSQHVNPASYDTYFKAYSMAMLPREREELNYGGKSTSSPFIGRSGLVLTDDRHSFDASFCASHPNTIGSAVSLDVQTTKSGECCCIDPRRCIGVRRTGGLRPSTILDDEDVKTARGRPNTYLWG